MIDMPGNTVVGPRNDYYTSSNASADDSITENDTEDLAVEAEDDKYPFVPIQTSSKIRDPAKISSFSLGDWSRNVRLNARLHNSCSVHNNWQCSSQANNGDYSASSGDFWGYGATLLCMQ